MALSPEQAVDAANETFGRHDGFRALHAKGTILTGTFTATPEAAALTRAKHMQGTPARVAVRVSNGAGNPKLPDYAPDVRGFAAKFELPDGGATDIVAQTAPRFPYRTPDGFVELIRALKPEPASAIRLARLFAADPRAAAILLSAAPTTLPPASYAACRYYALHAFRWVNADNEENYVRYTIVPEIEQPRLKPWQARRLGPDYLRREIEERVGRGPVRYSLELQLAGPNDPVDDPTEQWPDYRRRIDAGTFELTALGPESEQRKIFDPTRVTDGIECSADPVLTFRPSAYSVSYERRSEG